MASCYLLADKYNIEFDAKTWKIQVLFRYFTSISLLGASKFLPLYFRKNPNFGKFGSKSKSLSKFCSKP